MSEFRHSVWLGFLGLLVLFGLPSSVPAKEPYMEFVRGLRQRGYYDTAEEYLRGLEQLSGVPQDVVDLIPYELGVTIRDGARRLLSPEQQRQRYDESLAAFERFVKQSPNHKLAGRANSERGKLLVEKARVDIWEAESSTDENEKKTYYASARKLLKEARAIFTMAAELHEKNFRSYPGFIPEEQRVLRDERDATEAEFIQAQLNAAETIYWEGQTYPRGSKERNNLLADAMVEFEKLHTAYRSMIGGLYARLWQGKCLEEMDRIGEALGIYREILLHPGKSQSMRHLKSKAQHFQLICYNHEKKHEYRLVNRLASEWLRAEENRRIKYTETGNGIEWEQAKALESLGDDRTVPEKDQTAYLNQALSIARKLARRTGALKAPAASMVARLSERLGRSAEDPTDFSTAYGRADQLHEQAMEISQKVQSAAKAGKMSEAQEHLVALQSTASEASRMLDLALALATPTTEEALVRLAELRLALAYYYQERYYASAAVAQHFLRTRGDAPQEMLQQAANIALAALNDAYRKESPENRQFEREYIQKISDMMAEKWPGTELAVGAYFSSAELFADDGDYLAAAEAWKKVPQSSPRFGMSRLRAGASMLVHYSQQARLPEPQRPSPEELIALRDQAEQLLQTGLDTELKRISSESTNTDHIIRAKVQLAEIRNQKGIYTKQGNILGSIELLTSEPHAVVKAIELGPGEERPEDERLITSRQFASIVYQKLLRAYIGAKNLEAARDARAKLEQIGAGDDAGALTAVFVEFGRQLQQELEQLKAAGDNARLAEVRSGFESFLNDLFERDSSQQTFSSLLWIAETYASLGEGTTDDLAKSTEYFDKSAQAYQQILDKGASDSTFFSNKNQALAVKIRLMDCRVRQKDFEAAETVLLELLQEAPKAVNVQFDGAALYQKWAEEGEHEKYEIAIKGRDKKAENELWGWGDLARRMKQQGADSPFRNLYYDATYNYARCYEQFAAFQSGSEERKQLLKNAVLVLDTFARTTGNVPDEVYRRMNELYRQLLEELGDPIVDLGRGARQHQLASRSESRPAGRSGQKAVVKTIETPTPKPPGQAGNILIVLILMAVGVASVGGILYWTMNQSKKKRAARLAALAAAPPKKKKVRRQASR